MFIILIFLLVTLVLISFPFLQLALRQNAIELEKKEQREKELRAQIIAEAEEFKTAFYEKRIQNCATNMVNNREREKVCEEIVWLLVHLSM